MPCLDNYADTVHHNLKCPECRAEHSIPYDGAKGFPTNLTLAGFLDIHLEATDDNSEQIEAYIHRWGLKLSLNNSPNVSDTTLTDANSVTKSPKSKSATTAIERRAKNVAGLI